MASDDGDQGLTEAQLAELKALLVERRAVLARPKMARVVEPRGDQPDPMDAATDATDDDERILLSERDRVLLDEIDAALARMTDGTYGQSEESGEPIGYGRLRAVPWARLTVAEAEAEERAQGGR